VTGLSERRISGGTEEQEALSIIRLLKREMDLERKGFDLSSVLEEKKRKFRGMIV